MKPVIFLAFAQNNFRRLELGTEHDQIHKQVRKFGIEPMMAFQAGKFVDVFTEQGADFQVFHYGGHGAEDAIFTYNGYSGQRVSSQKLVDYLACFSLKLVFLNACDTAQIAQKFQKIGISAIGTNGKIDDDVAVQFAHLFYGNLAQGKTLENAFSETKTALPLVKEEGKSPNDWQLFATDEGKNWKLEKHLSEAEEKLKNYEAEKNGFVQKIGNLQDEFFEISQNSRKKDSEINELKTQLEQSTSPEEKAKLEAQIQTLQAEKALFEQEKSTLENKLYEARQKVDALNLKIGELEAKLAFAEQQLEALRQKYKEIDFSQNTDAYKQAYELLLEGKTNEADQVLNHAYLEEKEQKLRQQTKEHYRSLAKEHELKAQIAVQKFEFEEAHQSYQKAIDLCPDAEFWFAYAYFLQKLNYFDQAILYYQKAIEQYRKEDNLPYVAHTLNNLALLQSAQNDFKQAEPTLKKALQIYRKLENPKNYLAVIAMTLNNLALLQEAKNEFAEALGNYQVALQIRRELALNNPQIYLLHVAMTLNNLANLHLDKNEMDKALDGYQEALQIYRKLAVNNPNTYLPYIATTLNNLALLQQAQNDMEKALTSYQEALKIYRELAKENPKTYLPDVAMALNNFAILYSAQNETNKALAHYQEALQIYRELAKDNPKTYLPNVAMTLNNLGELFRIQNNFDQAEPILKEALQIYRELAGENPSVFDLNYCSTALNSCILYMEFVQQGLFQYVGQANELLEDVAFRLHKYPHIPQAQWHIQEQLIPLRQFFGQYQDKKASSFLQKHRLGKKN